jgi:hypothetical protein
VGEAVEVCDLGAEPDRREGVDAAEAAQASDRLRPGALGGELREGRLDGVATLLDGVDRGQVVGEGGRRGQVVEVEAAQPVAVGLGPVLAGPGEAKRAAAQEVREPLAGAVEIAAQILARPDQVAQLLLIDRGDVHERQLARGQQAGEALGIASVGLDPVGRPSGNQSRRADAHVETTLGGGAGEREAGRAGLVDGERARPERLQELERDERIAAQSTPRELARRRVEHSGVGLRGVDVEANERRNLRHAVGTSHSWGVGRRPVLRPSPRTSMSWGAGPSTSTGGHRPLHRV